MLSSNVKYIGLDVHKEAIAIAVVNGAGKLVMESIVETKSSTVLDFLHGLRGELHAAGGWSSHREKFEVPGRTICLDGGKVGATVPDFIVDRGPFHLCPFRRARQRMHESPNLHLPSAKVEIEIMLAVSRGGLRGCVRAGGLSAGTSRLRLAPFRIARSGLVGHPVDLPALASIERESLLEVRRAGVHARPVIANKGRLPVNRIRGVEIAMTVPELSDLRRVESTMRLLAQ
jgi:hypothetical protein